MVSLGLGYDWKAVSGVQVMVYILMWTLVTEMCPVYKYLLSCTMEYVCFPL